MTDEATREQALRDAYWAHRRSAGHRGECCQDPCFADITERWVALVTERAALSAPAPASPEAGVSAGLDAALTELLDDYLDANGPDGYPQPMPEAWRIVARYLGRTDRVLARSQEPTP